MIVTTPLASGREADVYALDERRVLRRYRRPADVTGEVAVMAYVAGFGYPVPAVYEAKGPDMVLERLDGPTMRQAMESGALPLESGASILANLLGLLHDLPPRPGTTEPVLHLDLHPENVLITGRGPVVIDWCNATCGDADLDTGLSALIVAQAAAEGMPVAGDFLDAFLAVAPGDPLRMLDEAADLRRRRLGETTTIADALSRVRGEN